MASVICSVCALTFNSKKSFVLHLISKSCYRTAGERAKSSTRNREEMAEFPDYPTREIVPVQGCLMCKRYSRAGMQMYMLYHLTSHVTQVSYQKPEVVKKRKSLSKQVSSSEIVHENEEVHDDKEDEDSSCSNCDMAFENKVVLTQHLEEIHV